MRVNILLISPEFCFFFIEFFDIFFREVRLELLVDLRDEKHVHVARAY